MVYGLKSPLCELPSLALKAKLSVDGSAIGDSTAQFYYVYLNLESSVQSMVLPQLSYAEHTQSWDYHTILDQLSRVYDNPNKQSEAEDKLHSLRQGNDSLSAYIAKFERTFFRNGLNSAIRSRLAQQLVLPRVYADFLRTVQQLSSKTAAPPYQTAPRIASDPMDISELTINVVTPAIGTLTSSEPISPAMPARSTSKELRQLYRQTGRCVRCGSQDHFIKNCSLAPASTATGSGSGKWVTTAAIDNHYSDTESDSGSDSDGGARPDIDWRRGITTGVWK